jgi:hypothetical protein
MTRRGAIIRGWLALFVFALFLAGLALTTGCTSLKAAADCIARPDAPCEGDDPAPKARDPGVRDMDPAAIPDARRLHPQEEI